jgi:hypothetical protein
MVSQKHWNVLSPLLAENVTIHFSLYLHIFSHKVSCTSKY